MNLEQNYGQSLPCTDYDDNGDDDSKMNKTLSNNLLCLKHK